MSIIAQQPDAIPPPQGIEELPSHELLRVWLSRGQPLVSHRLALKEPKMWGSLLAEVAQVVVHSYAAEGLVIPELAMAAIKRQWEIELGGVPPEVTVQ